MKTNIYIILILAFCNYLSAQRIIVDGYIDDWQSDQLVEQEIGDDFNSLDILSLWTEYDDEYLYIRFDVSEDIILQRESDLVIAIDTDNNASTGFPINGLGTEFSFYFDNNSGFINFEGNSFNIRHGDVGLYVAPAYESSSFEIALRRDLGNFGPIIDNEIKFTIFEDISNGDRLPNIDGSLIDLSTTVEPEFHSPTLSKAENTDFRLLSMNVLFDNIFEPGAFDAYKRVFTSIDPDIIAFQEIYDHSSVETASLVESLLPSGIGELWYHEKVGNDIIMVSRHPIVFDDWVSGNGAFVLDVDGEEIMIFNVHFPCCDNDQGRDEEIDALLQYYRNTIDGDGSYPLEFGAPIFIVGDYNLVGGGQQLSRILEGDIKNNTFYGPDFEPDWNGDNLIDAAPSVINSNLTYTWNNPFGSYTAGRLDFVVYTGSTIYNAKQFILDTRILGQTDLFLNDISQSDSEEMSDHLPVVSDWSFTPVNTVMASYEVSNISCFGDSTGIIQVSASGGKPPYTYSLNFGTPQSNDTFTGLPSASYILNVFDDVGFSFEINFEISENAPLLVQADVNENEVSIIAEGGVAPYLFSIDGGISFQSESTFTDLPDGEYTVLIEDNVQCLDSVSFLIVTNSSIDIGRKTPVDVYPNPFYDHFDIHSKEIFTSIQIIDSKGLNVYGNKTKSTNKLKIDTALLQPGFYMIRIEFKNGDHQYLPVVKF